MTDETVRPVGVQTLADVFFTLGAMALLAFAVSALAVSRKPPSDSGLVLVASRQGVTFEGRFAPLDRLFTDQSLRERVRQARADNEAVTVVIRPDGLESAFVLEPLLGGLQIRQKRSASGQLNAPVPGP